MHEEAVALGQLGAAKRWGWTPPESALAYQGQPRTRKPMDTSRADAIRDMLRQGFDTREISEQTGASRQTVYYHRKRLGLCRGASVELAQAFLALYDPCAYPGITPQVMDSAEEQARAILATYAPSLKGD